MNKIGAPSVDLDSCAREPIRIPGLIQPHGALVVADPDTLGILHVSANAAKITGVAFARGETLQTVSPELAAELNRWLAGDEALFLRTFTIQGHSLQVSAHRGAQGVLVEFEAPPASEGETLEALYPRIRRFVDAIAAAADVRAIANIAVREMGALTGFNRVMLYSFDATGDGTVLAEVNDGVLPSYLDLRFPASDIPAQARELYRLNRLRLIPNANYTPVPVQPPTSAADGKPLDLGFAALRSVSPIHLEYMRNMGTLASMSVSILVDGALWGLISLHNATPALVNAQVRTACDFIGQIVSLQIGARERGERAARRIALKQVEGELLAGVAQAVSLPDGLAANVETWLALTGADGAAVVTPDQTFTVGSAPSEPEVTALAALLHRRGVEETFATDSIVTLWPQADAFASVASGLIAISISQLYPSYIMWFRQEFQRTVQWSGDPRKDPAADRLHPRKSFDIWKQQVRQKSAPWTDVEIGSATEFRNAILNFVLRRAEERAALSEQLQRTNNELETFSYSVSHDLRAPFRHIAGFAELLSAREQNLDEKSRHYLDSITEAALSAGRLVDALLNFSQLGRAMVTRQRVDTKKLVSEVQRSLAQDMDNRKVEWTIGELPPAYADGALLRQVWANLIDNALKYTNGRDKAAIVISAEDLDKEVRYSIADNGVGFDNRYVGKLFGVFQRLHRTEDFPGTGIGLALIKRIVERHGGKVSAEGKPGEGAVFSFTLPKQKMEKPNVRP